MKEKHLDVSQLEPDLKGIGRRIREIRFRLGMDAEGKDLAQREFGTSIGITGDLVGKMERGMSMPTLTTLVRVAALSGRSMDWLVLGKDISE